eukprot:NODE_16642_length_984_cov_7.200700.p1 GENE.NODE_16642_length_984_cov_7.200700~~NODE_16642_length_984_cov_7.200700.p1  ORF type:complete len:228 (-),score=47.45 NODE_16642_length_984_cov_7.200700:222-905(-)
MTAAMPEAASGNGTGASKRIIEVCSPGMWDESGSAVEAPGPSPGVLREDSSGTEDDHAWRANASGDDGSSDGRRSDDTVWDEAEGAAEDDQVADTNAETKEETLMRKLELFLTERYGPAGSATRPTVAVADVLQHTSLEDFWCVLQDKVFDLGPFLRGDAKHPGGKSILARQLEKGGQEALERFVRWHNPSGNTVRRAPDYFIGDLQGEMPSDAIVGPCKVCCCIVS